MFSLCRDKRSRKRSHALIVLRETDQVDEPLEFATFPDLIAIDGKMNRENRTLDRIEANQDDVVYQLADGEGLLKIDSQSGIVYAGDRIPNKSGKVNVTVSVAKTRGTGVAPLTRVVQVQFYAARASFLSPKRVDRSLESDSESVDICQWTSGGDNGQPTFQVISGNDRNAFALAGDQLVMQVSLHF